MKNSSIISAFIGGAFFAASEYVLPAALGAMSIPISLCFGIVAFGAGNLVLSSDKENKNDKTKTFYDILNEAKNQNSKIQSFINKVEDKNLIENIKEIHDTVSKIIDTISKNPKKLSQTDNFFNYYLPVTVKILTKYDEIENQGLTTNDSKEFMSSAQSMIAKISESFKVQLSRLYQLDILDADAEMKVFDNMLKTDGFTDIKDFNIK